MVTVGFVILTSYHTLPELGDQFTRTISKKFLDSITGPVVQGGAILAIIGLGLALAFGAGGGVLRQAMGIMFGISLAFAATSFGMSFFGFAGGLAF
jgi:type IV secretion system protein VirB2